MTNANSPAFPQPEVHDAGQCQGLTKKELFVAVILNGILSNDELVQTCINFAVKGKTNPEEIMCERAEKIAEIYFRRNDSKHQKPTAN
jgi:hypothetical protein